MPIADIKLFILYKYILIEKWSCPTQNLLFSTLLLQSKSGKLNDNQHTSNYSDSKGPRYWTIVHKIPMFNHASESGLKYVALNRTYIFISIDNVILFLSQTEKKIDVYSRLGFFIRISRLRVLFMMLML